MSKNIIVVSGIGFSIRDIVLEDLIAFFVKHLDTIKKVDDDAYTYFRDMEYVTSSENVWSDFLDYTNHYTNEMGIIGLISDIMSEEHNIRFSYKQAQTVNDNDDFHYIMFVQKMPWEYLHSESEMSEEHIYNIMSSYIHELKINADIKHINLIYE